MSDKYELLGTEIGRLVDEKNRAYGASFDKTGEILRIMAPDGLRPDQYHDALAVVRILDKCFRILTDRDAMGESPYRDIAGYGILGAHRVYRVKVGVVSTNGYDIQADRPDPESKSLLAKIREQTENGGPAPDPERSRKAQELRSQIIEKFDRPDPSTIIEEAIRQQRFTREQVREAGEDRILEILRRRP